MQKLTDQEIAQSLLKEEKLVCGMINTAILEAKSDNLRRDWQSCLQSSYQLQKKVFDAMNQRGWYSPAKADMQQLTQAQNQFQSNQMQ